MSQKFKILFAVALMGKARN